LEQGLLFIATHISIAIATAIEDGEYIFGNDIVQRFP
jgi:hypothetical protein